MIILETDRDAFFGEFVLRKGVPYVMADAVGKMIYEANTNMVRRFDKMNEEYKHYSGEDLDGKSLVMWRTGGFGDLLFVSSLVHHMKRVYPNSKINVATSYRFHDIWKGNNDISGIASPGILPIPLDFLEGHDYQLKFEGTIEADDDPDQKPAVDQFSELAGMELDQIEKLPYYPGAFQYFSTARNKLKNFGVKIKEGEYACIQFKSSSIVRDWDYVRMIEMSERIAEEYDIDVLIMGNDFYHEQIQEATQKYLEKNDKEVLHPRVHDITELGLRFLYSANLIARAKFAVTVDSALVHVAAATFTPCISLYGAFPGGIRTKYYDRNITIEHPGSCSEFPNGCLQHTQAGPNNVLPIQSHCKENIEVCKMMAAISVEEVMENIRLALDKWGNECYNDRYKMFLERKNYGIRKEEVQESVVVQPTKKRSKSKQSRKKRKANSGGVSKRRK